MKDFDYRELMQKGIKEFGTIDHNAVLTGMLKNNLESIINFPKQNREEIKKYQLNKLSELTDYAFTNIPLYKRKFDSIGFKPGDIRSFDDFEQLPILYKDELIEAYPYGIVKNLDDLKYSTRSSGSSGRFVTIAVDLNAIYTDTLQGIRQLLRQSDFRYREQDGVLFTCTNPWWITQIDGKFKQDFLPTTTTPKDALDHIMKTRPLIIDTYPTYLQKLCELGANLSDSGVKYVIVHSEQSDRKTRLDMGKALCVQVRDEYSSEELTRIALECKSGNYHLEEDSCYVEVLDEITKQKMEKGTGLVVGTNLLNHATPIIRYHQGDIVTIDSDKTCDCGHNGRIITEIQGREMDCIQSAGKRIPASAFMDLAYNWYLIHKIPVHSMKYQIAQTAENVLTVYLKKGAFGLTEADYNTIKESMYSLVDRDMKINIEITGKFIQNSKKFKPVINTMDDKTI